MKKIDFLLIIIVVVICFTGATAFAGESPKVVVNETEVYFPDAKPFVDENGRTLVPVRFVSEELGGMVSWDGETKTVTIIKDEDVVSLKIGQKAIKINDISKELDTASILVNGRTFVPLRFVTEAFGGNVEWDVATQTASISGKFEKLEDNAESLDYFRVGDWIYFSNTNYGSSLFKVNVDGTGRQRLNYDNSRILTIENDWIYYLNNDENNLCKVKVDGQGKTLLGEWNNYFIAVNNGWIYYSDNYYLGSLYRMLSPEKKEKLADDIKDAVIDKDKIYYLTKDSIHSMLLDGTNDKIIVPSGVTNYGSYTNWVLGDWIYYKNYDTDELFIVSKDGSKKEKLPIKIFATDVLMISDGWVYYRLGGDISSPAELYRIKIDGTQNTKIVEIEPYSKPIIEGDWIYFRNKSGPETSLHKIKLDGTKKTRVSDDIFSYGELFIESVENDWVYYGSSIYNSKTLYRVKVDGSEKRKLWEAHNNYDGGS